MMICPVCGSENSLIKNTRQRGNIRRRFYQCECGVRFKTAEIAVASWKEIPVCDSCLYRKRADAKCLTCGLATAAQTWEGNTNEG